MTKIVATTFACSLTAIRQALQQERAFGSKRFQAMAERRAVFLPAHAHGESSGALLPLLRAEVKICDVPAHHA